MIRSKKYFKLFFKIGLTDSPIPCYNKVTKQEREKERGKTMRRIFVDMDGTIADFYEDANCLERMMEKDFFYNLRPMMLAQDLNDKVESGEIDPENLYILSACVNTPYCMREKRDWVYKYLPFIPKRNIILIKVGENKADMVEFFLDTELTREDILIDDYTKNLIEWEWAGGTGIKALNGINGKNGVWKGLAVVAD